MLGDALLHGGDVEAARAQGAKALSIAGETGYRRTIGYARLVLGEAALARGAPAEAEAHLQESVAIYRQIDQWDEGCRALASLAYAVRGLGQRPWLPAGLLDELRRAAQGGAFHAVVVGAAGAGPSCWPTRGRVSRRWHSMPRRRALRSWRALAGSRRWPAGTWPRSRRTCRPRWRRRRNVAVAVRTRQQPCSVCWTVWPLELAGQQGFQDGPRRLHRPRPVADLVLQVGRQFGHRLAAVAGDDKDGVVAKAVLAARREANLALAGAVGGVRHAVGPSQGDHAAKAGRALPLGHARPGRPAACGSGRRRWRRGRRSAPSGRRARHPGRPPPGRNRRPGSAGRTPGQRPWP